MQLHLAECELERKREAFRHVSVTGERRERVIADVRALENAADDLREIDDASKRLVVVAHDEEARMPRVGRCRAVARDVCGERAGCRRRLHPARMQPTTYACLRNERL